MNLVKKEKPLIVGHRGSMGTAPENTAVSFLQAVDEKAEGVEFDVHMSKDGSLIVMHDERVDRTTDGTGLIKDLTLAELKELDAGFYYGEDYRGEKILTLEETLELVKNLQVINIELKNGPVFYPGIEEKVLQVIKAAGLEDRVIVSSFNHYSIHQFKELAGDIKVGLLYTSGLYQPWEYARMVGAECIHPYFASILPELISPCQQAGIEVNVFGANQKDVIKRLLENRVDMIITDYPAKARQLKEKWKSQQKEGES